MPATAANRSCCPAPRLREARIRCLEIASDLYGSIGAPYTAEALLSVADLMWDWFMAIGDDEPNIADEQPITETRQ